MDDWGDIFIVPAFLHNQERLAKIEYLFYNPATNIILRGAA